MASLVDILAWRNISTAVQKVETGIPDRLLPQFKNLTEDVLGDFTTYITFYGQRAVPKRVAYGAPSRAATQRPMGEESVRLLHFAEHIQIEPELLLRLRQTGDLMAQVKAQEIIARAGADFRIKFDNGRLAVTTLLLATGKCYFDSGDNVLPNSSGADSTKTIDLGVHANNLNQLNGIIDVTWSTDTAKIIQHIEDVRVQMRKNTGRALKYAFYGKKVAPQIFANTTTKTYWQFNETGYKQFMANPARVPNGFADVEWVYMGDCYYEDAGGTVQMTWPDDCVVFTPEIDRNFFTLYQGSLLVPKSYGIAADVVGAMENFDLVHGIAGYAIPQMEPPGAKAVFVDTFMPAFKSARVNNGTTAGDLFIADVNF